MRKEIYFTIGFSDKSGFTDQLAHLKAGRKLGLSLGYAYLHSPFCTTRIERVKMPLFPCRPAFWPANRHIDGINRWITRNHPMSIRRWAGLNAYFARQADRNKKGGYPNPAECKKVRVDLTDQSLKKFQVVTFEDLQRLIEDIVSREKSPGQALLLIFDMEVYARSFVSMTTPIPDPDDDLDFRAIYMEQRRKRPCKSQYPGKGVKTLMHLRLGDVASVRTPWKTWAVFKPKNALRKNEGTVSRWSECRAERDFNQLTVTDFSRFIHGLITRFDDDALALSVFSDGFERTFYEIHRLNPYPARGLRLEREQLRALLKRRRCCTRELKTLNKIRNSVLTVGETSGKFFKLLDAAMTANLLIAAFPMQWGLLRMMQNLLSPAEIPPAVLLYKPVTEERMRRFLEDNSPAKIIPVDVSAPNFDDVTARLVEFLPQLATFLRSQSTHPNGAA